jgi:hypothetical protein
MFASINSQRWDRRRSLGQSSSPAFRCDAEPLAKVLVVLLLWSTFIGTNLQLVSGHSGSADILKAYAVLGLEDGSGADEAIDAFVDLVILKRSLEADLTVRICPSRP